MNENQGTPKTLRDAIKLAIMAGPMKGMEDRLYFQIRDFIAQRIGAAILLQHSMIESALMKVFDDIVEEKKTGEG